MQDQNDKLTTLLKQWPEIEPRPAFDQDVLRRIRLADLPSRPACPSTLGQFLDDWAVRLTSGWGFAAAVAVAVMVGFVLASATPAPRDAATASADGVSDLLASDAFSGSYVAMLNGGGR